MPRFSATPKSKRCTNLKRSPATVAWLAVLVVLGASTQPASSQDVETETPARLAIFLDCDFCDEAFVRQELTYVDHVRDREVAGVHILVTREDTGAGGEAQTFDLIGLGPFQGMDFSTLHTINVDATEAEARDGFLRTLRATLVPYLMQTSMRDRLRVDVAPSEEDASQQTQPEDDPWDNWTIEMYWDGSADFESQQRAFDTRYGVYINRVTEDWKLQFRPFFNYNYDRFDRDDEIIESSSHRDGFTSYVVRSISPHWSIGGYGDVLSTIYNETEQLLPEQILNVGYRVIQPWGDVDVGIDASQYLHDLSRYSAQFSGAVDVRITQGLSIQIGGSFEFIRDQLNLRKGDADLEEVLLRRTQLETDYQAGLSFGFRYRFGSIFNNVVNTRFGGIGNRDRF